jgi:hypothetical protein
LCSPLPYAVGVELINFWSQAPVSYQGYIQVFRGNKLLVSSEPTNIVKDAIKQGMQLDAKTKS